MAGERTIAVGGDVRGSVLVTGDRVQVTVGAPGPGAEPPAFRVLTLIARPLDSRELPDIAEARALAEGLASVRAPVYLGFVRPPTPDQLRARLQEGWDVFHFDGHGTAEGGGALALEDEDGLEARLPARDLADLLRRCICPRLLILSACQSAGGDGHGLAGHLLRETGAGAVIGFRETVSVETTREFLRPLYAALGAGRTVREAVEAARAALPEEERDLPVLLGERADEPLAPPGRRGEPVIERAPLYGVPAYAEFRFYGDYLPGDPPGRKWLLAGLLRAMRQGERFVVLAGPGGIGKSALAALAAERLVGRFPGGVFWTDGAAYLDRGLNPDGALEVFAAVLGGRDFLTLPSWTAKWQAVQAQARRLEAPFLWVLDNADVADEAVWRLARELPAPSAVLLTTRERPERGGCIFRVDPLTDGEAVRLLWTEAHRRREPGAPPLPDDPATWEALAEIVRLLEGHPLALLVAAALVADEGPQEALEAVRANPARGETARRFDFSYNRLPEPERRMLARLAAFAADVDRPIAEAIAAFSLEGGEPDPIPDPPERLRELVRRSFLALTPTPGGEAATPSPSPAARERGRGPGGEGEGPCYHLHSVLRAYVRGKPESNIAREDRRMVRFYLPRVEEAYSHLNDPEQAREAVARAAAERLNLIGAQEAALERGMRAEAVDFAYWLDRLFERSGHWDLRRRALENGLKAATPGTRDEAAFRHNLGVLAQDTGDYGQARQFYERAAETFRDLGARREQAAVLHQLGMLAQDTGDYGQARRLYEESLRISEELGDRAGVAQTFHQLGTLAQRQGDYDQARRLYEESLRIAEELGDRAGVAQTLHQLGNLAYLQGDYGQARQFYERAAETFRDLGARREQAAVLHQLGMLAQDTGDYGQARQFYQESLRISEELGDRAGVATTLHGLGNLAYLQGDYGQARQFYQESLRIEEELGNRAGVAQTLHQLGMLAQDTGDYGQARRLYEESLRIEEELGNRAGVALTQWGLGNLAYDQGNYPEARSFWEAALGTFRDLGDHRNEAGILHQLGMLAQDTGDYGQARRLYEESLRIKEELGDRAGVAQTLHNLGVLAQDTGDYGQARQFHQESLRIKEELGDRAGVATTLHQLGNLAYLQGDYGHARQFYERAAETFRNLGAWREQATVLHNLGALAQDTGDYGQARQFYQESLRIEEELGDRAGVAHTLHGLGNLAYLQGDYGQARQFYQESLRISEELGNRAGVAHTLHGLGNLAYLQGDYGQARQFYQESLRIEEELGNRAGVATTTAQLALLEEAEGNLERALELITRAEEMFARLGSPYRERARRDRERIQGRVGAD